MIIAGNILFGDFLEQETYVSSTIYFARMYNTFVFYSFILSVIARRNAF
jgi:hypothetical protein